MANDSVIVKYFVELTQLKEKYFLKVVLLQLPKLMHTRGEVLPALLRDVKSGWIVSGVTNFFLLLVHHVLWL